MRFKIGQKVVCTNPCNYWVDENGAPCGGPKFNEICQVSGYDVDYVILSEYTGDSFAEIAFEPLISDEQLASELSSIPETILQ